MHLLQNKNLQSLLLAIQLYYSLIQRPIYYKQSIITKTSKNMNPQQKRLKALSKYLQTSTKNMKSNQKSNQMSANIFMKDNDDIMIEEYSSSESVESSEDDKKRNRIQSSDQGGNNEDLQIDDLPKKSKASKKIKKKQAREQKQARKDRKIKKKLKKVLGLSNQEDIDQFFDNLQVDGIDRNQILKHLKENKIQGIKLEEKPEKKKNKKHKEKKVKNQQLSDDRLKYEMFEKSQSSDLQIPEQARTIYRNKDGTIRECSAKEQKQKKKQQVFNRLAQWQKGITNRNNYREADKSDDQNDEQLNFAKNNKVWDDPMKRWEEQKNSKFLSCKFQGPANRFNIKPGFRWDGVIRGNGFENRYLREINLKKANKDREHRQYMKNL